MPISVLSLTQMNDTQFQVYICKQYVWKSVAKMYVSICVSSDCDYNSVLFVQSYGN